MMKYSRQSKFYLVCIGTILSLVLSAMFPVAQAQEERTRGKFDRVSDTAPTTRDPPPYILAVRNVYISNRCSRPIRIALRYKEPSGNWVTKGWWSFSPNESSFLASRGKRIGSDNRIFYYFAESTDGSDLWWTGDKERKFGNRTLPMREREMDINSNGDFQLSLTCN